MTTYFNDVLLIYQCAFRKRFRSQQCLIVLVEKWGKNKDKEGSSVAFATDFSKAFNCILHDLLIERLHVYDFDMLLLKLIYTYLRGRKPEAKINNKYSLWEDILLCVPQGSILGTLLFNIFHCDAFIFTKEIDIACHADDNTLYAASSKTNLVIKNFEQCSNNFSHRFERTGQNPILLNIIC